MDTKEKGATLVDHIEIKNFGSIVNWLDKDQLTAMKAEFKVSINGYLKKLATSPVRSLADFIAFNERFPDLEKLQEYGQTLFLDAERTNGIGELEKKALMNLTRANQDGFEKLMKQHKLDALVAPMSDFISVLAIGGYPGISVPAGYDKNMVPFGICFGGLTGSEAKLIEIAYAFEQATRVRKPPPSSSPF